MWEELEGRRSDVDALFMYKVLKTKNYHLPGALTQLLRALVVLTEDLDSILILHMVAHNNI